MTIGLRADKPRPGSIERRRGSIISHNRAKRELYRIRAEQVGHLAAAATLIRCQGVWGGKTEPTIQCEIKFMATPHELRRSVFRRHMIDLAEKVALRFGQEEVLLHMDDHLFRSNAPGERGPKPRSRGGRIIR